MAMQHLLVEQAPSSASSSQSSLGSWFLHRRAGLERTDPLPPHGSIQVAFFLGGTSAKCPSLIFLLSLLGSPKATALKSQQAGPSSSWKHCKEQIRPFISALFHLLLTALRVHQPCSFLPEDLDTSVLFGLR